MDIEEEEWEEEAGIRVQETGVLITDTMISTQVESITYKARDDMGSLKSIKSSDFIAWLGPRVQDLLREMVFKGWGQIIPDKVLALVMKTYLWEQGLVFKGEC